MSIPFKELAGSPHESYGPQGMTAERRLICAWTDRRYLVQELLGDGYEFGGSSPVNYPDSPNIVAVSIKIEPLCDDMIRQDFAKVTEGLNAYQGFAKLTVHYELLTPSLGMNLTQDAPANTFLTYQMDLDTETVRVDHKINDTNHLFFRYSHSPGTTQRTSDPYNGSGSPTARPESRRPAAKSSSSA
jgi:hypothetical protein